MSSRARVQRKLRVLAAAALLTAAMPAILSAQQTQRGKEVGKRMMCMCGGCSDSVTGCTHTGGAFSGPCQTAKGMQKEVDQHVERGESDESILDAFVAEYGPTVLLEPPKRGFNLLAWIFPVAIPLIALILVWEVVRRWRRKTTLATAGGPSIDHEFLARAQRESSRGEDE
jgi:cytochrome c-type biogenesis protein CcmH/NrfF